MTHLPSFDSTFGLLPVFSCLLLIIHCLYAFLRVCVHLPQTGLSFLHAGLVGRERSLGRSAQTRVLLRWEDFSGEEGSALQGCEGGRFRGLASPPPRTLAGIGRRQILGRTLRFYRVNISAKKKLLLSKAAYQLLRRKAGDARGRCRSWTSAVEGSPGGKTSLPNRIPFPKDSPPQRVVVPYRLCSPLEQLLNFDAAQLLSFAGCNGQIMANVIRQTSELRAIRA